MRHFTSILILLLAGLVLKGQSISELKSMVLSADTILLVSHKQTDGFTVVNEKTGGKSEPKKVVVNGRPNTSIITKTVILSGTARQTLAQLITRQSTDKKIETCNCFIPFHSVLLIKDSNVSFVDICFGCNTFVIMTKKYNTEPIYFGKENMKDLEMFFRNNGIQVE